jgi:hypothetical protein
MTTAIHIPGPDDWRIRLRRDGYVHFRNLCPETVVSAARLAIDHDLATNYDRGRGKTRIRFSRRAGFPSRDSRGAG